MKPIPLLLIATIGLSFMTDANAQEIQHKKRITYVDDVPLLKMDGGSQIDYESPAKIVNHDTGKLLFVITKHLDRTKNRFYNEIVFADVDKKFDSAYDYKPLLLSMIQNEVLTTKGELNLDKIDQYIRLFGR